MMGKLIAGALVLAISAGGALAESTTTALQFPAGTSGTTVRGTVHGADNTSFTTSGTAGQVLAVSIISDNPANHFSIVGPDGATVLFDGATEGRRAQLTLKESGTYTVKGYLAPDAASRGETARFSLDVSTDGKGAAPAAAAAPSPAAAAEAEAEASKPPAAAAAAPAAAPAATVPAGSPEFWQVTGITGPLNLRQSSSRSATVLAGVPAGTRLRNLGCSVVEGQGWCQVQTVQGTTVTAWAAQQYLRADPATTSAATATPAATSAQPGARPAAVSTRLIASARPQPRPRTVPTAAPTEKPAVTEASGRLPCSIRLGMPTRDCDYRVTREGRGQATITVRWPTEGQREIRFEAGRPIIQAGSTTERRGDLTVINIGPERYEIPDTVVFGG